MAESGWTEDELAEELPPLKISCTAAKCEEDLHCFLATKKMQQAQSAGACRQCGAELIDWPRVHAKRSSDVDHTFAELRREFIRHHFWHVEIDDYAIDHAKRKGRVRLHAAAEARLKSSVGSAADSYDGRQTPFTQNSIYYAQHATASCCRRCIDYWHAIPPDRPLDADELAYLHGLVVRYLDERLPDLAEEPQRVPRRPR